ncbi:MAG: hypothetical protein L6R43_07185 [Planctomycetes bacterium]|nr:hypothetical protein [Planctomycetota bacterium]
MNSALRPAVLAVLLLAGCSGGGGGGGDGNRPAAPDAAAAPLVLAAGVTALPSGPEPPWASAVDLARLGVDPSEVDAWYDLTTPAGEPFQFEAVSRRPGNAGAVTVGLAHGSDDGLVPAGGPSTIAAAGIVPSGSGALLRDAWIEARGDGFGRLGLRGSIDRPQVLVLRSEAGKRRSTALVRLSIGPESDINLAARGGADVPGVTDARTLYSSDSWMFGLPTAAVSGDRVTVLAYEGDRADPTRYQRYEMRLQVDGAGTVTGGASEEASPDSGNWRDHEVAALFNTLALVHSGTETVDLRLSFDRGATFAQTVVLDRAAGGWTPRLAQVAFAADYTLAAVFWKTPREGATDLVLVAGRPAAFDGGGSPTRFAFDDPVTLRRVEGDVTPLLTGLAWSGGGDLVVGYGFTSFESLPDARWRSLTQNRCAVLPFAGEPRDTLVEEEEIVGKDPSVAVTGSGDALRVFFAYEAADGVRLRVSGDAGRTFGPPVGPGDATTSFPTVLVREAGGAAKVDLLFLAQGPEGSEIHLLRWEDFDGAAPPTAHRVTRASMTATADAPPDRKVPGAPLDAILPEGGLRVTEVSWFGYDAVVDGEDVVLVYDEQTYDAWTWCGGGWAGERMGPAAGGGVVFLDGEGGFVPAEPPPLAPGLRSPVPAPDPEQMHQLKLLRWR